MILGTLDDWESPPPPPPDCACPPPPGMTKVSPPLFLLEGPGTFVFGFISLSIVADVCSFDIVPNLESLQRKWLQTYYPEMKYN